MPITTNSLNKRLSNLLKVQGYNPIPKDSTGDTTPVPDNADVFKFTFKSDGKPVGPAWITVDSNRDLTVYYDDKVMNTVHEDMDSDASPEAIDNFTDLLKQLKQWAQQNQLGFELKNQDHLESDMAQREHVKKQEQVNEGYHPISKTSSYNDSVPSVKIILQHTRSIQEGEQRFRNVAKIFLENTEGERILAPTKRPGIARIYARHLAEGGVPNDERWNHIKSLCEEYGKMAGFVRAVRGKQFNESAQPLVEAGMNHYVSLREMLGKLTGHRGYNAYFESWTPTLMETEDDDQVNLNELFVQETLDPRIESVMPILNKLKVNLGEMKEVDELAEWADNIIEDESLTSNNPQGIPEGKSYSTTVPKYVGKFNDEQQESVEEDLDANQKRVGQVGPTEKAKQIKGHIGKPNQPHPFQGRLVGASESVEHNLKEDVNVGDKVWLTDPKDPLGSGIVQRIVPHISGDSSRDMIYVSGKGKFPRSRVSTRKPNTLKKIAGIAKDTMKGLGRFVTGKDELGEEQGVAEGLGEDKSTRREKDQAVRRWFEHDPETAEKILAMGKKDRGEEKAFASAKREIDKLKKQGVAEVRGPGPHESETEYEVYQANLNDQFDFIGEPLFSTHDLGAAHVHAHKLWELNPDKMFVIWQERTRGNRGGYGPAGSVVNPEGYDDETEMEKSRSVMEGQEEGRPYVCVHAKKGKCEVNAKSSYEAARKAAKKWGLKNTAGIDAHLADKPKDTSSLEESKEGQEELNELKRLLGK